MDAECMDEKLKNQFVQVSQCRITPPPRRDACFLNFSQGV